MIEARVEAYLDKRVREAGGYTRKCAWIGVRGAPDRVVFLNGVHFIELKRPGRKPDGHQIREMARMKARGASVCCLDTLEKIDEWILNHTATS